MVMLTVFGGVFFYSILYPLPYANQIPLEQKVTVVNLDKSKVSFDLERMVNAAPQVHLVNRAHSVEEAKQQFLKGEVSGIFVIPEHFYRDLLLGKAPTSLRWGCLFLLGLRHYSGRLSACWWHLGGRGQGCAVSNGGAAYRSCR
ncbi:ABC-type multidrug transport system [Vibrio ishigakensis]|uniref:ABC-type multidrug transport system n=1 Tax=Vibrio ishigakensis TaxID=1481914 RepID=A0A0B8P246_9VIBR|nr:ABC-type multidrug transport system [Vibrio ishigakensis]